MGKRMRVVLRTDPLTKEGLIILPDRQHLCYENMVEVLCFYDDDGGARVRAFDPRLLHHTKEATSWCKMYLLKHCKDAFGPHFDVIRKPRKWAV